MRFVVICLLLAALTLQPSAASSQAVEAGSADQNASSEKGSPEGDSPGDDGAPLPEPPRQMTRSELQRQIEFVQRELEELLVRIGEDEPSANQRKKLSALLSQLNDLREQMADVKQETEKEIEEKGNSFKAKWLKLGKAAEEFTTYDVKDGMFRIRFGVRFQVDATAGNESAGLEETVGTVNRNVNFRRARIFALGRIFRRIDYHFEWDFAIDNGVKDVWIEGSKWTKFMKWRVGRFKEPYSLARHTSAANLNFLEWAAPVQAIAPGRGWGIMFRHNEVPRRLNWALSLTAAGKSATDDEVNSDLTVTARLTGLPVYQDDGRTLLHLGGAYSARNPNDGVVSFSARPEARFVPDFIATGDIPADRNAVWGIEAAAVVGRVWAQAEWLQSEVPSDSLGDLTFRGSYVAAGYFYTGENRFYRTSDGTFDRVTPNRLFKNGNPFTKKGDCGALEFVARYSALDLNSGLVRGGAMKNYGVGMNWYLSESSAVKLNLIHSDVKDVGGANVVLLRYQFDP